MTSIILHISDLHVTLDKKIGGGTNKIDSFLTTDKNNTDCGLFIDRFISCVQQDYVNYKVYLLVTGDITNAGEKKEYEFAESYLLKIIEKLNISKENILLIPGDHDLTRREIEILYEADENCSKYDVNISKFKNFGSFYANIVGKDFDANKVIFDSLLVEKKIRLLGINSCFNIDLVNKLGEVPVTEFENELENFTSKNEKLIACVHHNITSSYENTNDGQWESGNRQAFIQKLLTNDINIVLTGNEHSNGSKELLLGDIKTSDAGCLTSVNYDATFKIYPIEISDHIILENKIYALQKTNNNDKKYEWDKRTNRRFSQPEKYIVFEAPPQIESEITDILIGDGPDLNVQSLEMNSSTTEAVDNYYSPSFTDVLYDKVKELKIFYSGHFHWSETSRAHNWIDVSKLIEDKANLDFLKNAVIDVIDSKIRAESIDLIIGLGYEGNIIATKSAIKFDKPYSFLPYSYRYDEHHEFECEMNFDNINSKYRNVLIITDVVNDGRTIRKLIKKRQEEFFKNVETIFVISLFYTGDSPLSPNVLNFKNKQGISNYDIENDEEVNNIRYYTVKSLKVEKCPYGKNFRDECFIFKDDLSCVNLFYDQSKYD